MIFTVLLLGGCSKSSFMDISAFTDYYNRISEQGRISLEDYSFKNGRYSLVMTEGTTTMLMSIEALETGKIDEIRLLIPKVNECGEAVAVTRADAELFSSKLKRILEAYTDFTYSECEEIISSMGLTNEKVYNSVGELTFTKRDWHTVYYSTELTSFFSVYNIHLHPTEKTEKPPSRPAFGNTAYTKR